MGNDRPIVGDYTRLIVGDRAFHYETDFEALETAESLPDVVRWEIELQHGKGVINSEKYRSAKPKNLNDISKEGYCHRG